MGGKFISMFFYKENRFDLVEVSERKYEVYLVLPIKSKKICNFSIKRGSSKYVWDLINTAKQKVGIIAEEPL